MTDDQSEDPQREVQRLAAELARKERENTYLEEALARTNEVQGDLWSHDIYLKARRKMLGGVIAVLGVLSAFGLVTVYDLYRNGLDYVGNEMKETADSLIQAEVPKLIQAEVPKLFEDAKKELDQKVKELIADAGLKLDKQVDQQIGTLVEKKKIEIGSLIGATEKNVAMILSKQAQEAEGDINQLVERTEKIVNDKIARLEKSLQEVGDALSKRAREILTASQTSGEAVRAETMLTQGSVVCDPNPLDKSQVALIGIRQLSTPISQSVGAGRKTFRNTLYLDVRGTDETTGAVKAKCILDAVDRVVYGADPNWYSPSEFVRIDRENKFRFTISGWGPTVLTAQVYFIGRRDPMVVEGHLAIETVAGTDKKYLDDKPIDF